MPPSGSAATASLGDTMLADVANFIAASGHAARRSARAG